MCDQHEFTFDVDRAYANQVLEALAASPEHPLSNPSAPKRFGVYALYQKGSATPVYIGQAVGSGGIAGRLRDHFKKIDDREGLSIADISCRFLTIAQQWEVARAEDALISRYSPPWNGIPGFSMHVPGRGRPGMPDYSNEWERRYPPRAT